MRSSRFASSVTLRFRPGLNALECRTVPSVVPANATVVGSAPGDAPLVTVMDPSTGQTLSTFQPFESSFRGGTSVATGDVTGDGTPDIVVGAGAGGGPRIEVIDGATGQVVKNFFVFEPSFTGGVSVAVGDVNNDGNEDIIIGAGSGGGPRVLAIDYKTGNVLSDFFAFESAFRGGVTVASADVNGDGFDDYIVGTGVGGAPRVAVYSGQDPSVVLQNFFAYDSSFRDGVNVGAGDVNGDGDSDIVIGSGTGGAPHVRVISGLNGSELANFFAFNSSLRGGARAVAVDSDDDGRADVLVVGTPGHLRRFFGSLDGSQFQDVDDIAVTHGAYVSAIHGHHGKGHGHGNSNDDHGDGDQDNLPSQVSERLVGTISDITSTDKTQTITISSGDTDDTVKVTDNTRLIRNGQVVSDLSSFSDGDIIVAETGGNGVASRIIAVSSDTQPVAPPISDKIQTVEIQGTIVDLDDANQTEAVLSENGTLYLIQSDADTKVERNNRDAKLSALRVGDFGEFKINKDQTATQIEVTSM
jgi:hypothetical protein